MTKTIVESAFDSLCFHELSESEFSDKFNLCKTRGGKPAIRIDFPSSKTVSGTTILWSKIEHLKYEFDGIYVEYSMFTRRIR